MTAIKHTPSSVNLSSCGLERPQRLTNYLYLTAVCSNIRRTCRTLGHDMSLWTDHDILALEEIVDSPELDEFLLQM